MFSTEEYLAKIGYEGPTGPTLDVLRRLQKRHMMVVPFDNSVNADTDRGLSVWDDVDIDVDKTFDELIAGGRGGLCYELNGLFRRLLVTLGYQYEILAGAVRQVDGSFGPDLEHIFGCVRLGDDLWLVDVGIAGPSYLEPLRLADEVQEQYGVQYRLFEEEGYWVVQRRPRGGTWQAIYRFRLRFRDIGEWNSPDPKLVEFPAGMIAVGTYIHSRAIDNGQLVLIGRRLLELEDGEERIRILAEPDAYKETVTRILSAQEGI
ncbi:amide synthase [Frankia sp. Hr75.2]|nr:amide synthase [Frankia sp. Hr75.2]